MRQGGNRAIVVALLALFIAIPVLLTVFGPNLDPHGSSVAYAASVIADGLAFLLTLSYASWYRIWWISFLRPRSYGRGITQAIRQAVIAAILAGVALYAVLILGFTNLQREAMTAFVLAELSAIYAAICIVRAVILVCLWWRSVPAE